MKKKLSMVFSLILAFALAFSLVSCGECDEHVDENKDYICDECDAELQKPEPPACEHVDADDNAACDKCGAAYTDGCDAAHKDANDDGLCDFGGEAFEDGCDAAHKDANDDGLCDFGGEAFEDGCDHVDANDDAKCDKCDEPFEDAADTYTVKFMRPNNGSATQYTGGKFKVAKDSKFTDADLEAIAAIVFRGVGIEVWYIDIEMTKPFDFANTAITADMELYGLPSSKAGLNVEYSFDAATGTLTFTGTGDMFKFQTANDVPWYKDRASITSVVIGEGITSLANNMLAGAANVTSVTLPSTIKTIGENAFSGSGITGIFVLNDGVEVIERNAFYNTSKLTAVIVPESLTSIGYSAFEKSGLANVYYTGSRAADHKIEVADSNSTFLAAVACYYMEECPPNPGPYWYYKNNVPTNWCYALKYYVGDATVPTWVDYVFVSEAKAVKNNINFRNNISLNGYQFQKIEPALELNDPVTSDMKFICYRGNIYSSDGNIYSEYADGKLSIKINDTDATTETWDFEDKADVAIFAENSNTPISLSNVTSLEIAQGITYIGKYMFAGMSNVDTIIIPASVTAIHADAFDGCTKLTTIYYGGTNNVMIVNDNGKVIGTLNNCGAVVYTKVLVGEDQPGNWYKIYETEVEGEIVEKYLAWTITEEGVLYVGGDAEMVDFAAASDAPWYIMKDSIVALVVLDGVVSLGENMVNGYEGIETVELPKSVKDVPSSALAGTGYMLNQAQ